jgi:hypothetical protein
MGKQDIQQDDCVHEVLYMIPSTKYQYEKDGEKVLSAEYDDVPFSYQQLNSPIHHYLNYHGGCYCNSNCRAPFNASTPELTDSSTNNSPWYPTPVQLVDPPMTEAGNKPAATIKRKITRRKTKSIKMTKSKSIFERIKTLFSFSANKTQ